VVIAIDHHQVARILAYCHGEGIKVVPRARHSIWVVRFRS